MLSWRCRGTRSFLFINTEVVTSKNAEDRKEENIAPPPRQHVGREHLTARKNSKVTGSRGPSPAVTAPQRAGVITGCSGSSSPPLRTRTALLLINTDQGRRREDAYWDIWPTVHSYRNAYRKEVRVNSWGSPPCPQPLPCYCWAHLEGHRASEWTAIVSTHTQAS